MTLQIDTYAALVQVAATTSGVPYALLRKVAQHESKGDPLAIGDGGVALGLMQVHPGAAKDVGGDWVALKEAIVAGDTQKAAEMSLTMGSAYLAKMLKMFSDEKIALMAYNQGPTVISHALAYANEVEAIPS